MGAVAQNVPEKTYEWHFEIKKDEAPNKYTLYAYGQQVNPEWHIWVHDLKSEFLIPTQLFLDSHDNVGWYESYPVKGETYEFKDDIFGNVAYFVGDVTFSNSFTIYKNQPTTISGYVIFQSCNSTTCLPPQKIEFSLPLPE